MTQVDSKSTGASTQAEWQVTDSAHFAAGLDLRYVQQQLVETVNRRANILDPTDPARFTSGSSIPRSVSVNPGLFMDWNVTPADDWTFNVGSRGNVVSTNITADVDLHQPPVNSGFTGLFLFDFYGTDDVDRLFGLSAAYASVNFQASENLSFQLAAGHGQRAPSLTELYAAGPFMFLLQNGQNALLGNPTLRPERRTQVDLGTQFESDNLSLKATVFQAWIHDAITFENLGITEINNVVEQVVLTDVNTDLATLTGFETVGEYRIGDGISLFGTLSYVQGTDQTRNGEYGTDLLGLPLLRVPDKSRGFGSDGNPDDQPQPDNEPLPGIPPLEARLGGRHSGAWQDRRWMVEFSTRIVDRQKRVARTLEEAVTPGFTVWDVRGQLQLTKRLELVAGVENFTNKAYQEPLDFRSQRGIRILRPGVNYYFGSEVTW